MKKALPAAVALLLTLTLAPAAAAHAAQPADSALQLRIDATLATFPGGEQIAPNAISWDDGSVILELAAEPAAARAISTCATGKYCAWSGYGYSGTKLSFTTCSAAGSLVSLGPLSSLGGARSLANARSSGTVTALNGSTVVYAVAAGVGVPSFTATATHLRCFT